MIFSRSLEQERTILLCSIKQTQCFLLKKKNAEKCIHKTYHYSGHKIDGRLLQTTVGHFVVAEQYKVIKERCVKKRNGVKVFIKSYFQMHPPELFVIILL